MLWQVSAFTVAHSITLALSIYAACGVAFPRRTVDRPVDRLRCAREHLPVRAEIVAGRTGICVRVAPRMGFAGALKELGLARADFLTALLTFNAGVEAGQLTVIAVAFLLVGLHWEPRLVSPPHRGACVGADRVHRRVWTLERLSF